MKITRIYIILSVLTILMLSAVVYAFTQTGSPFQNRQKKFDSDRLSRIKSISSSVNSHYLINHTMPQKLSDLKIYSEYDKRYQTDPETNQEFEYRFLDGTMYEICANFYFNYEDTEKDPQRLGIYNNFSVNEDKFKYKKGHYCFQLNANPNNNDSAYPYAPFATPQASPSAQISVTDRSTPPSCTTLGGKVMIENGKGFIGCDIHVTGEFDLSKSYCTGVKSKVTKNLIPDGYNRKDWYYATLTELDPTEEVKVYIYSKTGERIECTPTLNRSSS